MSVCLRQQPTFHEASRLLQGAFQLDHSTSVSELGSLFEWQGQKPVQRLKRNLAAAYDVAWSFPSTQGTTVLNVLALLTACPPGGRVLVNRDAHGSVTAAMIQGGFRPTYLVPRYDRELGLSVAPTLADVKAALDSHRVDCVFLTSPNYFGIVGELAEIVAYAQGQGLPVVVDAAHAPHFHFCQGLPPGAEDVGADCVTQSTHKVATALSQGSLLLLRNESHIEPLYEHVNELGLVSTSFSFPILASIELGVRQLVEEGEEIWTEAIARAETFRDGARALPDVTCFGSEQRITAGFAAFDPTRVTLDVSATRLTGYEFERRLHREHIYPEMATLQHVLFLVTPGTTDDDVQAALSALARIARAGGPRQRVVALPPPPLPEMAMIPRAAKFSAKHTVPLDEAVGKIAGETIATYPPGAPLITAGEVVSPEVVEYLRCVKSHGAVLKGAFDPWLRTMRVLDC